jgi:hypothetical protein
MGKARLTIARESDKNWPEKNKDGRQELEIRMDDDHISFEVCVPPGFTVDMMLTITFRQPKLVP